MSTLSRDVMRRLEKALYDYVMNEDNNVKSDDDLPSVLTLRREVNKSGDNVAWIQVRKFIRDKQDAGTYTIDVIKSDKGKIKDDIDDDQKEKEVVTRKEIRKLSDEEVDRFVNAMDKMMESKQGPGSSEYFRLASIHGSPGEMYCAHGLETFPGWHRIYLYEFELALQAADKENNNDGKIALPFWDWTTRGDEGLPSVIRNRLGKWPDDLFPKDYTPNRSLSRNSDNAIRNRMRGWQTVKDAYDSLDIIQHYAHVPAMEEPHGEMHSAVGGAMGFVPTAAYDPVFWLHHCNVDRIYESYIRVEPDSQQEFEHEQEIRRAQGLDDLYDEPFRPFKRSDGSDYYPKDTFDTKALGYQYDELLEPQESTLTMAPTLVVFPQVKVWEFAAKCPGIHVYVIGKDKEDEFKEPQSIDDIDATSDKYGGGTAIFARGEDCSNCLKRPPIDIRVDISQTLIKLQLSRYDAIIKVYTTDDIDGLTKLSDSPLPEPVITGPFFENNDEKLDNGKDGVGDMGGKNNPNEVKALQQYLARFGYYDSKEIDGIYGPKTTQAVMDLQKGYKFGDDEKNDDNLKVDGYVGPKTKRIISSLRRCGNVDPFANNEVADKDTDKDGYKKQKISYYIDIQPGYLDRERVEEVIDNAFKQWADASEIIEFVFLDNLPVSNKEKADIVLSWILGKTDDNRMGFDGAGGVLGHGGKMKENGKGFVNFDLSERWIYGDDKKEESGFDNTASDLNNPSTWYRGKPKISLLYVALHEIGHVLGLDHEARLEDVMGPYYNSNQTLLKPRDIERIKELYPKK